MAATASAGAPAWKALPDLASERLGGTVVFATDEWFAQAPRLLMRAEPVFLADEYTAFGKWMDGWESRRKRVEGHDWCIVKLGEPGTVRGIEVDTAFFTGNHSPRFSLQGACLEGAGAAPALEVLAQLEARREDPASPSGQMGTACTADEKSLAEQAMLLAPWHEMVPFTTLQPGYPDTRRHFFAVTGPASQRVTHVRLNMFPDGGIARLRVHGEVVIDWHLQPLEQEIDLVSVLNGGLAIGCSNKHFGEPSNLISPGRGVNMGDGWETARHPDRPAVLEANEAGLMKVPGSDWAVLQLATPGTVERVEIDTAHFRGNFPESCMIEGCMSPQASQESLLGKAGGTELPWVPLVPRIKLGPDQQHFLGVEDGTVSHIGPISHVRLTIYPDGGISRLRLFGKRTAGPTPVVRSKM